MCDNNKTNLSIIRGVGREHFNLPKSSYIADKIYVELKAKHKSKKLAKPSLAKAKAKPAKTVSPSTHSKNLTQCSEGIRVNLENAKLNIFLNSQFDPYFSSFKWAKNHLGIKYKQAILSLIQESEKVFELYKQTLEEILSKAKTDNSSFKIETVIKTAQPILEECLEDQLEVLTRWSEAIRQARSGLYHEIDMLVFIMEQTFDLFFGKNNFQHDLKSNDFQVGNVFMAYLKDEYGPATYSGSKGPVGAHLVEFPSNERKMLSLMLPLYMHEFRHNVYDDIINLSSEMQSVVKDKIISAYRQGKLVFQKPFVKVGSKKISTIDFVVKLFLDSLSELDADINGGILLSGPAYIYGFTSIFAALNNKSVITDSTKFLLTVNGFYDSIGVDENDQINIEFEPHPPDYLRALMLCHALDLIGMNDEAQDCRQLIRETLRDSEPTQIVWSSDSGNKTVLKLNFDEIVPCAKIVVETLLFHKFKALNNHSMTDFVNWNKSRQEKVDKLTDMICSNQTLIPQDFGDIFPNYVGSAAVMAYWHLIGLKNNSYKVIRQVERNSLRLLKQIKQRFKS